MTVIRVDRISYRTDPIFEHLYLGMPWTEIDYLMAAKGALGDDSASLLGALLVSSMALAAFSRIDTPEEGRPDFFLYLDEFQNFTTLSVANMISEMRKFRVALTLANQHLAQLEPDVRHAVLGNAGTLIVFRIGAEDAMVISREFMPTFEPEDLISLPNFTIYLKLLIDRGPSKAFSATTLNPAELPLNWEKKTPP